MELDHSLKGRPAGAKRVIVFRADASSVIGMGHLMRCLTLADELRGAGTSNLFLCRQTTESIVRLVTQRGHAIRALPEASKPEEDAVAVCGSVGHEVGVADWIVVDHYGLGATWESTVRSATRRVMAIDDLANRPHACDLLLDQNDESESRYHGLTTPSCRQLLGPRYALLRPDFRAMRALVKEKAPARAERLLITMGGADDSNETLKALTAVQRLGDPRLKTTVVIGALNRHAGEIAAFAQSLPGTRCETSTPAMAALMTECDLAIGGGGTTSWERCCLGVPSIVLSLADNQVEISQALDQKGISCYLGRCHEITADDIKGSLARLICDQSLRTKMRSAAMRLVDGSGAAEVSKIMLNMCENPGINRRDDK